MKERDRRIVVCPRCQGAGVLVEATGGPDICREIDCPVCGGARVMERCITIEYRRIKDAGENWKENQAMAACTGTEPGSENGK